jgi:hypothetical protein
MRLSIFVSKKSERTLLLFLMMPVLAADVWCGIHLYGIVQQKSVVKEDYAQVNSIRNGLLSVNVWKSHLGNIATERLAHLKFDQEKEQAVKRAVEKAVDVMIAEMGRLIQRPQKTFRGKVRKLAFKVMVDTTSLEAQSPQYAQAVLDEVKKPENMEKIRTLVLNQIDEAKNADEDKASVFNSLLAKYATSTVDQFNKRAGGLILDSQIAALKCTGAMIASVLLFLAAWGAIRGKPHLYRTLYTLSCALAFVVLLSALALPMIDIDARIRNVDFMLLGEHLQFSNQVLFYRSKSIMQMVGILISERQAQTILVGFLILLFSIMFPITKLLSTLFCLYAGPKFRSNPLVRFFAFHSGKWSMADVMVVAIFMAYIGFNGVLNSQLKNLNIQSEYIGVIATNQTALEPGYTLFVTFTLFGLILSVILKSILHERPV